MCPSLSVECDLARLSRRRYGGHRTLRVCTFFLSMPFGLQEFRWTILLVLGVRCAAHRAPYTVHDHCEYCTTNQVTATVLLALGVGRRVAVFRQHRRST